MIYNKSDRKFVSQLLISILLFLTYTTKTFAHFPNCAIIYQRNNNSSDDYGFVIPHLHKIPDFSTEYFPNKDSLTLSHNNYSVKLNPGCRLVLCDQTYFKGKCSHFNEHVTTLTSVASSGTCSCDEKNCDCFTATPVRNNNCAHAYITPCESCQADYVEIKEGSANFRETFKFNVTRLLVRAGCSLKTFEEEDYEGAVVEMENNSGQAMVFNNSAIIGSTECTCTVTLTKFGVVPNNISMIQLPNSVQDIINLQQSEPNHAGLTAALKSIKKSRSPTTAYILFLGSSGSGKSSLINLLFDNPTISAVGGSSSTTSDIREFRVSIPLPQLGLNNTEIGLIDTPGLGDTRGVENDARFLATLSDFIANHRDLQHYIPNIIIICHPFTDNRFSGNSSNFVRMLRALNFLTVKISDDSYSNVVFVYTHFLSEVNMRTNPGPRLTEFHQVISEYSLFPQPIVSAVAENKVREYDLPMTSYNYLLPNGELFPKNIYDKLFRTCYNANDTIGLTLFESALQEGKLKYPGLQVKSMVTPLLPRNNSKSLQFASKLTIALLDIQDTEISQRLSQTFQNMSTIFKSSAGNTLPILQKGLNIRNVRSLKDLPKTNIDIADLFSSLRPDKYGLALMEKAFQLQPVPFPSNNLLVGHSINVARGNFDPGSNTVIQNSQELLLHAAVELGYAFPSHLKYSYISVPQVMDVFQTFPSTQSYFEKRGAYLGIQEDLSKIKSSVASTDLNVVLPSSNGILANNKTIAVAYRGIRIFKLDLNLKNFNFTQHFIHDINNLTNFDESSYNEVEKWKSFFNKYGTHLITSVYGGGQIKLEYDGPIPSGALIFKSLDFESEANNSNVKHVSLNGGNQVNVNWDKIQYEEKVRLYNSWKKSLYLKPIILQQSIGIVPISDLIVLKVNGNVGSKISVALKRLLDGTLVYKPSPVYIQKLQMCQMHLASAKNSSAINILKAEINTVESRKEAFQEKMQEDTVEHFGKMIHQMVLKHVGQSTLKLYDERVNARNKCQRFKI